MTNSIENVMNLVANGSTISSAILQTYSTSKIRFPFNDDIYDVPVIDTDMDDRAKNALMRHKIFTLNDFIRNVSRHEQIRGMGNISKRKIFCYLLDLAWEQMSVSERAAFLLDTDERNTAKI